MSFFFLPFLTHTLSGPYDTTIYHKESTFLSRFSITIQECSNPFLGGMHITSFVNWLARNYLPRYKYIQLLGKGELPYS